MLLILFLKAVLISTHFLRQSLQLIFVRTVDYCLDFPKKYWISTRLLRNTDFRLLL